MLIVQSFINTPVNSNCYVLFDKEQSNDCIIVDPGSESESHLILFLKRENLIPKYIILTHEHFDHCWGVKQLVGEYHIPVICSRLCAEAIKDEKRNCSVFYDNKVGFVIDCQIIDAGLIDENIKIGEKQIVFFETPGHTEASISFVVWHYLFTGDTLIKDIRTVTKLPTGSKDALIVSLDVFATMQGKGYRVCPGHGASFELDHYDLNKMIEDYDRM